MTRLSVFTIEKGLMLVEGDSWWYICGLSINNEKICGWIIEDISLYIEVIPPK